MSTCCRGMANRTGAHTNECAHFEEPAVLKGTPSPSRSPGRVAVVGSSITVEELKALAESAIALGTASDEGKKKVQELGIAIAMYQRDQERRVMSRALAMITSRMVVATQRSELAFYPDMIQKGMTSINGFHNSPSPRTLRKMAKTKAALDGH